MWLIDFFFKAFDCEVFSVARSDEKVNASL